ncbi:unnamed protein product [Prunus armeniaca]|uniref:Uncharacterized protein n=1 Tax=Prunus armeniaca TaxID=36596 RepID=A0A6J5WCC5_PRUAR|nr:unnamed protein product [Prunus armeniaca]CAB4299370.1 unnamed protein product [Prunus armeniaca]
MARCRRLINCFRKSDQSIQWLESLGALGQKAIDHFLGERSIVPVLEGAGCSQEENDRSLWDG